MGWPFIPPGYRQLHDERLAGRRSEAERALAAVNNSIEELQNKMAGHQPGDGQPKGSKPTVPPTIDFESILPDFAAIGRSMQRAIHDPMVEARYLIGKLQRGVEHGMDFGAARQSVEDDIERERIDQLEDEIAKRQALIEFETKLKMRELQARGVLNEELRAKVLELQDLQISGIDASTPGGILQRAEAVFDARLARQMFGGRDSESHQQTQLQRQMASALNAIKNRPPGLPVVDA